MSHVQSHPAPTEPEPRPVRLGKYELIARIGDGGMAEVHLARMRGPMNFEKLVVVKTIHPELASQEEFLKMLFDEARLSALIRHPCVVDIYELGRAGETYFIAMEYLEGQALSTVIAAGTAGFAVDPMGAARIIADAAAGLHAAHELRTASGKLYELVHRDISPGNIMVLYDGGVKLVDFGVAKARGRLTQSAAHQMKGKLGYASPEQLAGRRVDRRSDIYSLGVVLWEVLANRRLWPGDTDQSIIDRANGVGLQPPSAWNSLVPPELDDVVMTALASRVENRYQTAAEMKQALESVLRSLGNHRETEHLAQYMTGTFARRREERAQLIGKHGGDFVPHDEVQLFEEGEGAAGGVPDSGQLVAVRGRSEDAATRASWPRRHPRLAGSLAAAAFATAALGVAAVARSARSGGAAAREAARASTAAAAPMVTPGPGPDAAPIVHVEPVAEAAPVAPAEPAAPAPEKERPARSAEELDREGAALFVQGKAGEAKNRFRAAIAADPKRASSYRGLGLAYQALGRRDAAAAAFQKYLKLSPDAPDAASIRARLEKLGK